MPAKGSSPTITDVALKSGYSKSTVSRALRGMACIPPETREKVRQVAERLGYTRNPYVSALMRTLKQRRKPSHQGTLAILDTLSHPERWKAIGVHRHFHDGAAAKAQEMGFTLERHWCGGEPAHRAMPRMNRVLQARGIHGLLIPPPYDLGEESPAIPVDYERFCCVTLGCRLTQPALCFAVNDQYASARLAVRAMHQRGYRRIGLVIPEHTDRITGGLFAQGMRAEAEHLHCPCGSVWVFRHQDGDARTPARLGEWLQRNRPDAILGFQPVILQWLGQLGFSVPDQIGVGFLDLDWDMEGLSGIDQNSHLVASAAVDLLVDLVYRNQTGPAPHPFGVVVEGYWRDGSTAPGKQPITER